MRSWAKEAPAWRKYMTDLGKGGGGLANPTHLPGIFQGLVAAALGSGLLPCVNAGWERIFHHPPAAWAEGLFANMVAALVLIPTIWLLTRPLTRLAAHRYLGKTPNTKGDRLSIYVANFGEDELSETARELVIATIRKELGSDRVEVLPAGIKLGLKKNVSYDSASDDARRRARSLLNKKHGDLLIWGKVYTMPEMAPQISLTFVSPENEQSRAEPFGLTGKMMLEPEFSAEIGAFVAMRAAELANPVTKETSAYDASKLLGDANRLSMLARNAPLSMRVDDRANLLSSYGLILSAVGQKLGASAKLEEAVAAYREVLKDRTRDHAPLDWARTKCDLAAALTNLGERENGTARLEEAVTTYREALEELNGDGATHYQLMAQRGLKRASELLQARKAETSQLPVTPDGHA